MMERGDSELSIDAAAAARAAWKAWVRARAAEAAWKAAEAAWKAAAAREVQATDAEAASRLSRDKEVP